MGTPLNVLLIDGCENDTLLAVEALRAGGYTPHWKRVDSALALDAALAEQRWDVILCDHQMPALRPEVALDLILRQDRHVPVIGVSGNVNAAVAAGMLRAGACDFVDKFHLPRLVPAVVRALDTAGHRRALSRSTAGTGWLAPDPRLAMALIRPRFEECGYDVDDYRDEQVSEALLGAYHDLETQWLSYAHVSWAHKRLRHSYGAARQHRPGTR